jgi:hypothetical protein
MARVGRKKEEIVRLKNGGWIDLNSCELLWSDGTALRRSV